MCDYQKKKVLVIFFFREQGRNFVTVSFLWQIGVRPVKQEVPRLVSAAQNDAQAMSQ